MATKASMKPSKATNLLEFDTDAIKRNEALVARETDEQILSRLGERFEILDEMTKAVRQGDIRAMIVSGPPGVGKSYGVEAQLQKADLFNTLAERKPKFEVVKGAMSALGLYAKLFEFSAEGNVVVFDDCDSILMEDLSLTSSRVPWIVPLVVSSLGTLTAACYVVKAFQIALSSRVPRSSSLTLSSST